ncbi:MAG TPA: hypothetical protein V6D09_07815 [Leptolyngbyaceae cyanobacterium]
MTRWRFTPTQLCPSPSIAVLACSPDLEKAIAYYTATADKL